MTESSTLPSLLWNTLSGLERACIDAEVASTLMPPLDLWANLLRAFDGAEIDLRELPVILRLSKRAVRTRISTAARHGWVAELKASQGRRFVGLTPRGSQIALRWKALQLTAEGRWRNEVGIQASGKLRGSLEKLVAALPLEHPHYPASYGPADARITGGNGVDWQAVSRGNGDTVSNLPLSALVSECVVAFAVQYEELSPVALSLSSDVIRRIPAAGRPLQDLGSSPGLSALIRHGFVQVSGDSRRGTAYLTSRGLDVHRSFEERIRAVEKDWCDKFGTELLSMLRYALENVPQTAGCAISSQIESP
jgi:hypothetical protein